jgi:hypothetical protein
MHVGEDTDFNLRLLEAGLDPLLCETESLFYRRHETNVTNDRQAIRRGIVDVLRRKLARQKERQRAAR